MTIIEKALSYVQNLKNHALTKGYGKNFCKSIQCRQADGDCNCIIDEICDLIIQALREQTERDKGCAWCKGKAMEWSVIDDDFGQYVNPNIITHCFHCGRPLKERDAV